MVDAAPPLDASPPPDAGVPHDAAPPPDVGVPHDTAPPPDASSQPDFAPPPPPCATVGDGICDEPPQGTGTCPQGTDALDCDVLCPWANDGYCDEGPAGACAPGTDVADCDCETRDDGICDEPGGHGTGLCLQYADGDDCVDLCIIDGFPLYENGRCDADFECTLQNDAADCGPEPVPCGFADCTAPVLSVPAPAGLACDEQWGAALLPEAFACPLLDAEGMPNVYGSVADGHIALFNPDELFECVPEFEVATGRWTCTLPVTSCDFDPDGRLESVLTHIADGRSKRLTVTYDAAGRPVRAVTVYDELEFPDSFGQIGATMTWQYTDAGLVVRRTSSSSDLSEASCSVYNAAGQLTGTESAVRRFSGDGFNSEQYTDRCWLPAEVDVCDPALTCVTYDTGLTALFCPFFQ